MHRYALALVLASCGGGTAAVAPVAKAGGPRSVTVGEIVDFDGSGSTAAVSWHWEFGDGATAEGAKVQHVYTAAGSFEAALTVHNEVGGSSRDTAAIAVADVVHAAPVARIAGPSVGRRGDVLAFDGSGSTGDSPLVSFAWSFGDGATATGALTSHVFAADAQYPVQLTVTDAGSRVGTASRTVTIGDPSTNRSPVASAGAGRSARLGTTLIFDGRNSYDPDPGDSIASWDWDFGDGSAHGSTAQVDHAWVAVGTYTVVLKVTDTHGATGQASASITASTWTGTWNLSSKEATFSCPAAGAGVVTFAVPSLQLTDGGTQVTAQDPNYARRRLTGPVTGNSIALTGSYTETDSCGTRTVTETLDGTFSSDRTFGDNFAASYRFSLSYPTLTCNCLPVFHVSATRQ